MTGPQRSGSLGSSGARVEDYVLGTALSSGGDSELWRATRRTDDTSVVLRLPSDANSARRNLAGYHHEFELLRALHCSSVPNAIELAWDGFRPVLVLADEGKGSTLTELLAREGALTLSRFLPLAAKMAEAVGEIHQAGVVHRALRPDNVLVSGGDDDVRLVGLDRATRMPEEHQPFRASASHDPRSLPYMAPEQTGRMNRSLDYRADLYALGVMFFELLTDSLPLQAADLIGWVHAHIAIAPMPLPTAAHGLPEVLGSMLARLLAKDAGARYQNAFGLRDDLIEMQRRLQDGESMDFALGRTDRSGRLLLSQQLYGREEHAKRLGDIFEEVAAGGTHLVLVSGYSGIGKTALVHETQPSLVRRRGYFAAGNFDQYQRSTPFSAIRSALRSVIAQLAAEDRKDHWGPKFEGALGADLPLITELVEELQLLVGPQPAAADSGPDAEDRFQLAVRDFLSVICQPEHPFVLFLDDLQWIDHASIRLVEGLMASGELQHFLLVGAYRNNEVEKGHRLLDTIHRLTTSSAPITQLELGPLRLADLTALIQDTFGADPDAAEQLAERLQHATAGNPFFVRQYLRTLHTRGTLRFDFKESAWRWDLPSDAFASDNVVDLLVARLERFEGATVQSLRLAAFLGNVFDLATLASARGESPHAVLVQLWPAIEARLLLPREGREWVEVGQHGADLISTHAAKITFQFRHDRVQQAAYTLTPQAERGAVHLHIARLVRAAPNLDASGFAAVEHYNQVLDSLDDDDERSAVAHLNLDAAERAAAAIAHEAATEYAGAAIRLIERLDPDRVGRSALITRANHLSGHCLVRLGRFDEAELAYGQALEHCDDTLEEVELRTLCMEMYIAQGRLDDALRALVGALSLLGVELNTSNVAEVAQMAATQVARARAGRSADALLESREETDPHRMALLEVVGRAIDTAYMNGRDWLVATTATAVSSALEHGLTVAASMSFATYGLADAEPETPEGIVRRAEYGRLGARIAARFGALDWASRSGVSNPQHYAERFEVARKRFEAAADAGWQSGALTWGAYGEVRTLFMMLSAGLSLERLASEQSQRHARVTRSQRMVSAVCCDALHEAIRSLRGHTLDPCVLGADRDAEAELERRATQLGPWAACKYYALKQLVTTLHGDQDGAESAMRAVAKVGHCLLGMTHEHLYHLFGAITLAGLYRNAKDDDREPLREQIAQKVHFFEVRAASSSDFESGLHLVRATLAEVDGDPFLAMSENNRAVVAARIGAQHHLAGLANERAAGAAEAAGLHGLALHHLREAIDAYSAWGAWAKVNQLDARLGQLMPPRTARAHSSAPVPADLFPVADGQSLLKACQVLSGEIRLEALLRKQMEIVLQNAGAQRALLVLEHHGRLLGEAEAHIEDGAIVATLRSDPLDDVLHRKLIEHVYRSGEVVRIDDVSKSGRFGLARSNGDGPRCMLALPVDSKGTRLGVLWLAHETMTHAFPQRLDGVFSVLLGQIATSLENAFLFRDLKLEVEERTRTERVLREERDHTSRIVDNSPLIMSGISGDGTTLFINLAGERITGYGPAEVVGRNWWDTICVGDDRADAEKMLELVSRDGYVRGHEAWLTTRGGERRLVSWSCVQFRSASSNVLDGEPSHNTEARPRNASAQPMHLLCFGNDVTEAHIDRERSESLEASLVRGQRLESVGTLASGIAHDLNNLLLPIMAFASMLEEDLVDRPKALESAKEIGRAGDRASALVRQILAVGRKLETTRETVQLSSIANEVTSLLRATLPASIALVCTTKSTCPSVRVDPSEMHQVILNLATNAAQAIPGAGRLHIELEPVCVDELWLARHPSCVRGTYVRLSVIDTGTGIESETQARMFDPFFTTKATGTGLGLWVVHGIVERSGGAIEIESELGSGTAVRIFVPAQHIETVETVVETEMPAIAGNERVLLVDDDVAVLRMLELSLQQLGYRVTPTSTPNQAIEVFSLGPENFDAVITDLSMPQMDGDRLAERLSDLRPGIPILLSSGLGITLDSVRLRLMGIREVIQKPALGADYGAALRRIFGAS